MKRRRLDAPDAATAVVSSSRWSPLAALHTLSPLLLALLHHSSLSSTVVESLLWYRDGAALDHMVSVLACQCGHNLHGGWSGGGDGCGGRGGACRCCLATPRSPSHGNASVVQYHSAQCPVTAVQLTVLRLLHSLANTHSRALGDIAARVCAAMLLSRVAVDSPVESPTTSPCASGVYLPGRAQARVLYRYAAPVVSALFVILDAIPGPREKQVGVQCSSLGPSSLTAVHVD